MFRKEPAHRALKAGTNETVAVPGRTGATARISYHVRLLSQQVDLNVENRGIV